MPKYRTVRIPGNLIETVTKFIEEDGELGYRSHSEFIIDATRRRIEELMNNNSFKSK